MTGRSMSSLHDSVQKGRLALRVLVIIVSAAIGFLSANDSAHAWATDNRYDKTIRPGQSVAILKVSLYNPAPPCSAMRAPVWEVEGVKLGSVSERRGKEIRPVGPCGKNQEFEFVEFIYKSNGTSGIDEFKVFLHDGMTFKPVPVKITISGGVVSDGPRISPVERNARSAPAKDGDTHLGAKIQCKSLSGKTSITACDMLTLSGEYSAAEKAEFRYQIARNRYYILKDVEGAKRDFEAALSANPRACNAHTHLGYYYSIYGGDAGLSRKNFEKGISICPNGDFALAGMGWYLKGVGDLEAGERFLKRSLASNPRNAVTLANMCDLEFRKRDAAAARRQCAEAIAADPRYFYPHELLARMALAEGDAEKAKEHVDRAYDLVHGSDRTSFKERAAVNELLILIRRQKSNEAPAKRHDADTIKI